MGEKRGDPGLRHRPGGPPPGLLHSHRQSRHEGERVNERRPQPERSEVLDQRSALTVLPARPHDIPLQIFCPAGEPSRDSSAPSRNRSSAGWFSQTWTRSGRRSASLSSATAHSGSWRRTDTGARWRCESFTTESGSRCARAVKNIRRSEGNR